MIHIFGATGLIGYTLCKLLLHKDIDSRSYGRGKANDIIIDITEEDSIMKQLRLEEGDIVINLAAIAQPRLVFKRPDEAYKVNVKANQYIVNHCKRANSKYIYMSSVEVFDGRQRAYKEEDEKKPLNEYGRQKTLAEDYIQDVYNERSIIARTSWNISSDDIGRCFIDYMIKMMNSNNAQIAEDNLFTISSSKQTSRILIDACLRMSNGVVHIASPEPISRLEVANRIATEIGITTKNYRSCKFKELTFEEPRSQYNILDVRKSISVLDAKYKKPEELIKEKLLKRKKLYKRLM